RCTSPSALHSLPTRRSSDLISSSHQCKRDVGKYDFWRHFCYERRHANLRHGKQRLTPTRRHFHSCTRQRSIQSRSKPWHSGKSRSEEHTSELQSHLNLVCRL